LNIIKIKDTTGTFYSVLFLDSTSNLTQMVNFLPGFMTKEATSILPYEIYLDSNITTAPAYCV